MSVRRLFHRERSRRIALAAAILFLLTWEVGPFARMVSAAGYVEGEPRGQAVDGVAMGLARRPVGADARGPSGAGDGWMGGAGVQGRGRPWLSNMAPPGPGLAGPGSESARSGGRKNPLANTVSDNAGPIRTEQYGYDELSRLTSPGDPPPRACTRWGGLPRYGDGQTQTYSFDPRGNRLTKTDSRVPPGRGNDTYTYSAANMLLTRNGGAYTNDANGNTLTGGNRTNTWDGQNRLTTCVYNGTTTNHTYGGGGRPTGTRRPGAGPRDDLRRRTVQGSNTTDYVLDGQSAVRTLLNGTLDRTTLHGARGPEYERIGSNSPLWYLYDGLGSVVGTIDGNGVIQQTRKYDVYGAVRSSTGGSGTKHKFVGNLGHPSEDATGLIYMRARYMDPVTGRFSSEDQQRSGDNWFSYANGSPTNRVDPDGMEDWVIALLAGIIGGVIGVAASKLYDILFKLSVSALLKFLDKLVDRLRMQGQRDVVDGAIMLREGQLATLEGIDLGRMLELEGGCRMRTGARRLAAAVMIRTFRDYLEGMLE